MAQTKSDKIRTALAKNPETDIPTLADRLEVSRELVYGIRRGLKRLAPPKPKTTPTSNGPKPVTELSIRLANGQLAVVRIKGEDDRLIATLRLSQGGIIYLAPNQKTAPAKRLPWQTLGKLTQLSLLY